MVCTYPGCKWFKFVCLRRWSRWEAARRPIPSSPSWTDTIGWLRTPTTICVMKWLPQGSYWVRQMDCMGLCSELILSLMHSTESNQKWREIECTSSHYCLFFFSFFSRDDFVLLKLKKEAAEEGAFLLRWSTFHFHCIILAVLKRNQVHLHPRLLLPWRYCSEELGTPVLFFLFFFWPLTERIIANS